MERKTTIKKNKEGYGYKYTELAEINKYCEKNNITYWQEIETCEINSKDYIITYVKENDIVSKHRGCQIVEARLQGIKNPVQEYGSSLTYCRRYSLLMALGLSTDDDDGASCGELTEEQLKERAKEYKFLKGKKAGFTILEVYEDDPNYLQWCLDNGKNEEVKGYIESLTDLKRTLIPSEEEQNKRLTLINKVKEMYAFKDMEQLMEDYHVKDIATLTTEELEAIVNNN